MLSKKLIKTTTTTKKRTLCGQMITWYKWEQKLNLYIWRQHLCENITCALAQIQSAVKTYAHYLSVCFHHLLSFSPDIQDLWSFGMHCWLTNTTPVYSITQLQLRVATRQSNGQWRIGISLLKRISLPK